MSLDVDVVVDRGSFRLSARLRVPAGETVALLGPNGSGKSTLVATLAGLLRPARGSVSLDGVVLDDAEENRHVHARDRRVGIVFQDLLLFGHLTTLENVAFPLRARGLAAPPARREAATILSRLGAGHLAAVRPTRLSGGQAQLVALARALVGGPRLLLLDEPLAALAVQARERVRAIVRETLSGFEGPRILVTHEPSEAMSLADRLILMEGGRITQVGTPGDIATAPRTEYAADLVGLNLFVGRLVPAGEGVGMLETGGSPLVVAWPRELDPEVDQEVTAVLRPSDVALFPARPEGSSRNVLRGTITAITQQHDRSRVRVASRPPLVAEVTPASVSRLGLAEGRTVWASFKALEVRVVGSR